MLLEHGRSRAERAPGRYRRLARLTAYPSRVALPALPSRAPARCRGWGSKGINGQLRGTSRHRPVLAHRRRSAATYVRVVGVLPRREAPSSASWPAERSRLDAAVVLASDSSATPSSCLYRATAVPGVPASRGSVRRSPISHKRNNFPTRLTIPSKIRFESARARRRRERRSIFREYRAWRIYELANDLRDRTDQARGGVAPKTGIGGASIEMVKPTLI